MKTLLTVLSLHLMFVASSLGVIWDYATVSATMKQGTGNIVTTVLNNSTYLNVVAQNDGAPRSDLFVGIREDNGQLAVVRISTKTVRFVINTAPSTVGLATNTANTESFLFANTSIAAISVQNFSGVVYDTIKKSGSGSIKSVSRSFSGGVSNAVIKGTATTTGKKINL